MVAFDNSTFYLSGYHDNNIRVIFQNHLPKVICGSWQWSLGSNIIILFSRIDYFNITSIDVVLVFSKRNTCWIIYYKRRNIGQTKEKQEMQYTQISWNPFTQVNPFISLTNREDGIGISFQRVISVHEFKFFPPQNLLAWPKKYTIRLRQFFKKSVSEQRRMPLVSRHFERFLLHMAQVGIGQGRYLLACDWTQQRRRPLREQVNEWHSPTNPENLQAQSSRARREKKKKRLGYLSRYKSQDYCNSTNAPHTRQPSFMSIPSLHVVKWHANQRYCGKTMLQRGFAPSNMGLVQHGLL